MKLRSLLFVSLVAAVLAVPLGAQAQTAVSATTLSSALNATSTTPVLASTTAAVVGYQMMIDKEVVLITGISPVRVQRGYNQTTASAHASSATVYIGPASSTGGGPFWSSDPPIGACTYANEQYTLRLVGSTGRVWACSNGQWTNVIDAFVFLPATACNSSVSGNSTGTNGYTALGTAPSIPVVNAQTSNSSTNTHYFMCNLNAPSRYNAVKASYVVDVVAYYGVQTTGLGTQVAVLASGTMNSAKVFGYIDYPAAGASETPTGLAELTRADTGTLTILPVVASFNVATTTSDEFYSAKFTPSVPIAMATDNRQLVFTLALLNTATSATITNMPGLLVHYRFENAGF